MTFWLGLALFGIGVITGAAIVALLPIAPKEHKCKIH